MLIFSYHFLGYRIAAYRMFVRSGFLPLLMIGFLSSLFFATYLIIKEKKISPSGRRLVQVLETVTFTENGKLNLKSNLTVKTSVSYFTPKSD